MSKYSYSHDEEHYHGEFDSPEEALAESGEDAAFVGENRPPTPPEDFWRAEDWLEHVSVQDDYSVYAADGWDESTRKQRAELEGEVRKVLAAWLDRHDLRPKFWLVDNVKRYHGKQPAAQPQKGENMGPLPDFDPTPAIFFAGIIGVPFVLFLCRWLWFNL